MTGSNFLRRSQRLTAAIGVVLAGYAGVAGAAQWRLDNGTQLIWNTTLSVGTNWRAQGPSNELYSRADGQLLGLRDGLGGSNADSATLNYEVGDRFSTPLKLISDFEVRKGKFGGLVRIKGWYDQSLEGEKVRYGHQNNDYNGGRGGLSSRNPLLPFNPCPGGASTTVGGQPLCASWPTAKLNDDGFEDLQKFSGVYLLDAYAYGSFGVGDSDLQLRLGRQVVNWGESVFIQGINQTNPVDVTALRRPGTEVKEVLLPVLMAYANWGFSFGSVEAYYQFEWDNSPIDSCGMYWGPAEGLISAETAGCLSTASLGGASNPAAQARGQSFSAFKGREASDTGQFGLALRFPVDALDTEFGLYGMNVHAKIPFISARMGTHPTTPIRTPGLPFPIFNPAANGGLGGWFTGAVVNNVPQYNYLSPADFHKTLAAAGGTQITQAGAFWEYPEDIHIFGLTAATELAGWSVAAEASLQQDVPVQINGNDLLQAALLGAGPYGAAGRAAVVQGEGAELTGYERFDKTQFQVNAVKTFSGILGAESLLLVGEVGMQSNDVPDFEKAGSLRYGRAFIYGFGGAATNTQPDGRKIDGYVTDLSWGYRMRARLDYDGAFDGAIRVSPSVVWNHDVDGVAMDGQFIEGRQTLGLGVGFNYAKKYTVDLGYTWYADSAYNPLMDRDYYSASFSVTF